MAYRRPPYLDRMPAQAIPFKPHSGFEAPYNPFMPNALSPAPMQPPMAKPQPQQVAPPPPAPKPNFKGPAPKPVQGAATRTPMPAAPAPKQQSVFGDMNSLMSMMGGMDPQQMKEMRERFQRISDASISRQRNLLDKMNQRYESTLENKKGLLDLDWTPLLSLADNMTRPFNPTNYAQTYMQSSLRPESEMQRQRRLGSMEQAMLAGERGLMNQEIQALNQQGGMGGSRMGATMLREMMKDMRQDKNFQFRTEMDQKRWNRQTVRKNLLADQEFLQDHMELSFKDKQDLENIAGGLGDGSYQRVYSVLSAFSRLQGERGVLTEGDIARQLFPTLGVKLSQWEAWARSQPNKQVPDGTLQLIEAALMDAMSAAKNKHLGNIQFREDLIKVNPEFSSTVGQAAGMYELGKQRVKDTFKYNPKYQPQPAFKPKTREEVIKMTPEQRKAYKEQLLKGQ